MAGCLPLSCFATHFATGVSISTSSVSRSRVASKHMSIAISVISSRKVLVSVSSRRRMESLCWISGWSRTIGCLDICCSSLKKIFKLEQRSALLLRSRACERLRWAQGSVGFPKFPRGIENARTKAFDKTRRLYRRGTFAL